MRVSILCLPLLVVSFALVSACATTVPATVRMSPHVPIKKGSTIFVLAKVQRERIAQSLADAGLVVSDEWAGGGYSLTVQVGNNRARRDCGTVNNVTYVLNGLGQRLLVIKGRGATGSCDPNVFDDMSRTLASYAAGG